MKRNEDLRQRVSELVDEVNDLQLRLDSRVGELKSDLGYTEVCFPRFSPIPPEISVSQKIDAICEHLGLEIVKKTREEKIVCRWRSPRKSKKSDKTKEKK